MSLPSEIVRRKSNCHEYGGWWTFWYVRRVVDGVEQKKPGRHWRKLADTLPMARRALAGLQVEVMRNPRERTFDRITLAEFYYDHYRPGCLLGEGRKSWGARQRALIEKFVLPEFGAKYIDDVLLYDVAEWYKGLLARKYCAGKSRQERTFGTCYCSHIALAFKTMLRRAEGKYILLSPIRGLRVKPAERRIPKTLTREQVGYMVGKLEGRDKVMFVLWVSTGMRKSEMQWLQWGDIDLAAGKVFVRGKTGHEIKDAEDRAIDLTRDVLDVLVPYAGRVGANPDGFVFTDPRGECIRDIEHYARRLFRRVGMKGCANLLRHTFASMFLSDGGNIPELKAYMGHSSIVITEKHYAAFVPGRERSIHRIDFGLHNDSGWEPERPSVMTMEGKAVAV